MDYTLAQVFYYPGDQSLSGQSFRRIWKSLGCFGELPSSAYVYPPDSPNDKNNDGVRFGVTDDLNRIMGSSCCAIGGGASYVDPTRNQRPFLVSDLEFGVSAKSNWADCDVPAKSDFSISHRMLMQHGIKNCLDVLRLHAELASLENASYGLVDYAPSHDNLFGAVYGSVVYFMKPFHRLVESARWLNKGWPRGQARGLYWGNYLSNSMIERISPTFVDRYKEYSTDIFGKQKVHIWKLTNGVFFTLSIDPTLDRDEKGQLDPIAEDRANWLIREFCSANIL